MKHVVSPAIRESHRSGMFSLEMDIPEIAIELPTPSEIAMSAARSVAESLQRTIRAGQDAEGVAVRGVKQSTLERRARDEYAPLHPRTDRWVRRYPSRAGKLQRGKATAGRVRVRTTRWSVRQGWSRTTKFKRTAASTSPLVDSGHLYSRIRAAAAGAGSATVDAPENRPIAEIEQRIGANIFAPPSSVLERALEEAVSGAFDGWGGAQASAAAAVRRSLR